MQSRRKARVEQHIMESNSYRILQNILPKHWVIREFNHPDYGVDLVIEIFEPLATDSNQYEALGEYLYVQVKSITEAQIKTEKLYDVQNVAKFPWKEDKSNFLEAEVIKYPLDTISLFTVEQMGSSISFMLFLVDLKTENCFFICLNDLIDKFIRPKNSDYLVQETVTITIPAKNNLRDSQLSIPALKLYGKRAKLLAAFVKFSYQKNEIFNYLKLKDLPVSTYRDKLEADRKVEIAEFISMIKLFISQIENLDIWLILEWKAITFSHRELKKLESVLNESSPQYLEVYEQTLLTWHSLCNLSNMYEELIREYYLPKKLSYLLSYPEGPIERS